MQSINRPLKHLTGAFSATLALLLVGALTFTACDTTVNNPQDTTVTKFDAVGTVTGRVIDRVTSSPIEGVSVSLAADGDSLTATTDAQGTFTIRGVPANGFGESSTYSVHISTPDGSPYRPFYRAEVGVPFNTTDNGATDNLSGSVTFPLSKANATVSGRAYTEGSNGEQPLNGASLMIVERMPTQFDSEGNPRQFVDVQTVADTTAADGSFSLSGVGEGTEFDVMLAMGNENVQIAGGETRRSGSSGGSVEVQLGDVNVTNDVPAFEITRFEPGKGADADTTRPTFTFTFNRPLAQNGFVDADAPRTGEDASIVDGIYIEPNGAKAQGPNPGQIPVNVSISDDRTQLSVTPAEALSDGFEYTHVANAFFDSRFVDRYGIGLANANSFDEIAFSVGVNESQPAVPSSFRFNEGNVPELDYNSDFEATMAIDVNNASAEVKGYEVYARVEDTQDLRNGTQSGFFKLTESVIPEATDGGIVPVTGNQEFGTVTFDVDINGTPLSGLDGTYGPIEVKARAVSINNVRSGFTDVVSVGDSVEVDVVDATVDNNADSDPDADRIAVTFDEPVANGAASNAENYAVNDATGSARDIITGVESVENSRSGSATVVLTVADGENVNSTDELEVTSVEDLAGNGLDVSTFEF